MTPREVPTFEQWAGARPGKNARSRYYRKVRVWKKTGGYCRYCSSELDFCRDYEIDHVVPRSAGGTNAPDNLEPACVTCNRSKWNRPLVDFLASREVVK